ncbi:MAG: hypothetical protein ACRDBP_08340 [Luteolibacter sp.]
MAGHNPWSKVKHIITLHDLRDDDPDTLNIFPNFEVADEIPDPLAS